jgi:SOS-response transcriptional repressor LexA
MDIDDVRRANIRALEKKHGPELAKRAGMSPAQFYNLRDGAKDSKTGKPRGMRKETAWKIEDAAGVERGYLNILHSEENQSATSNILVGPTARGTYPLISEVQAGSWMELCDGFQPGDADNWLPSTKNLGKCGYMLRVSGKSMENPGGRYNFMDGVILHVNPDLEPIPGQFVIARRESTKEATFKRYVLIDGDPYLEAINPDWPKDNKYLKLQPGDVWCGVVVDASFGNLP